MSKHTEILSFISLVRGSHCKMEDIYTKGSCLNFYLILRHVYPTAEAYHNTEHIITKINDRFYDITGEVSSEGYLPIDHFYVSSEIYEQMLKSEFDMGISFRNNDEKDTWLMIFRKRMEGRFALPEEAAQFADKAVMEYRSRCEGLYTIEADPEELDAMINLIKSEEE